jgi:predicted regulator of Ras-like GTPase activity (Roadblock/LC7/MglB family)
LVEELKKLQISSPEIQASAIVSTDGLIIASALPPNVEEDRVSAMAAAMLSLGERISSELKRGELDQVYIRGSEGYVMLMALGTDAVLSVMANKNAKLGLIFFDIKRTIDILVDLI